MDTYQTYKTFIITSFCLLSFFNLSVLGDCSDIKTSTTIPCPSLQLDYLNDPTSPYYTTPFPGYYVNGQFGYVRFQQPTHIKRLTGIDIATPTATTWCEADQETLTTFLSCGYTLHYKEKKDLHTKHKTESYSIISSSTTNN